ncbi:MAG: Lrp/AsnC family transcriptional regulator [archaeon]
MSTLDLKDKKILYELDLNARQSNSQIAKKVRLNKNTVNYKIKRLEENKVILSYYAVIDSTKLGYFSFRVYLNFFNTVPIQEKEMIDWLKAKGEISVIGVIETIYDLVFMFMAKNVYEFDDFWLEFKKRFRKYFWNEKVDVFTKVSHFKRKYLLGSEKYEKYEAIGDNIPAKYDELDIKILMMLTENARMPLINISKKLKASPRTIAFRMKQLEKKRIILGYRVNINLQSIGYEYYKINMTLNDFEKYDSLMNFSKNHPNIIYIDRTLSDLDFEIDVGIKGKPELLELINEIKLKFNIRKVEMYSYKEYIKLDSMPNLVHK